MKLTNYILSLMLVLSLCFMIAACASADDKALEEADALFAAGDYDGAIAVYSTIGRYQEFSAKIAEAERLREEANVSFLLGKWINIEDGSVVTFFEDGRAVYTDAVLSSAGESFFYTYSNETVSVTYPSMMDMTVCEVDGVIHIMCSARGWDLVSELDYPVLAPYDVEITLDNWDKYFEIREVERVYYDEFGDPLSRELGYGIFLKDEYLPMLMNKDYFLEVLVEVKYDEAAYKITGDFVRGDYEMTPCDEIPRSPVLYGNIQIGVTETYRICDYRGTGYEDTRSAFYGSVAAEIFPYYPINNDYLYCVKAVNLEVNRITGSLTFKR